MMVKLILPSRNFLSNLVIVVVEVAMGIYGFYVPFFHEIGHRILAWVMFSSSMLGSWFSRVYA